MTQCPNQSPSGSAKMSLGVQQGELQVKLSSKQSSTRKCWSHILTSTCFCILKVYQSVDFAGYVSRRSLRVPKLCCRVQEKRSLPICFFVAPSKHAFFWPTRNSTEPIPPTRGGIKPRKEDTHCHRYRKAPKALARDFPQVLEAHKKRFWLEALPPSTLPTCISADIFPVPTFCQTRRKRKGNLNAVTEAGVELGASGRDAASPHACARVCIASYSIVCASRVAWSS